MSRILKRRMDEFSHCDTSSIDPLKRYVYFFLFYLSFSLSVLPICSFFFIFIMRTHVHNAKKIKDKDYYAFGRRKEKAKWPLLVEERKVCSKHHNSYSNVFVMS